MIAVTFREHVEGDTEVILRHDNWDALDDGANEKRDQYNFGWIKVFEEDYAKACQG